MCQYLHTSIQQIMQAQHPTQNKNTSSLDKLQIDNLFKTSELPLFDLSIFTSDLAQMRYARPVFKQLKQWNQRVTQNKKTINCRSQLFRNKFLYQQLKNIQMKKPQQMIVFIRKIAYWLRSFSKGSQNNQVQPTKNKLITEQKDIRRKFVTNTVQTIKDYRRKQFSGELQTNSIRKMIFLTNKEPYFSSNCSPNKQQAQNICDSFGIDFNNMPESYYKRESQRLRLRRQLRQINQLKKIAKNNLSHQKQRNFHDFLEGNIKLCSDIYKKELTNTSIGKFMKLGLNKKKESQFIGFNDNVNIRRVQKRVNSTEICKSLNASRLRGQKSQFVQYLNPINGLNLLSQPIHTPMSKKRKTLRK